MASDSKYTFVQEPGWKLWVVPGIWNETLWHALREAIESLHPQKHPQTIEIQLPTRNERLFLKVFHRFCQLDTLKDCFRVSKALRALKIGEALSQAGFNVADAIAAGEQRRYGVLERSFSLTLAVSAAPLPLFLRQRYDSAGGRGQTAEKRDSLKRLALEVRRLHALGFVHGDLVPSNILVCHEAAQKLQFFFLDNDRTRRYPKWFPQRLWKRNLIQLNRFPLAGISLQDRMRFFHNYAGRRKCVQADRQLLRWLERRTRERRRECDAVDISGSFRKLMQWNPSAS